MILERLRVESFGCFDEPVELAFDARLTVIVGDNETGKSTLFRALHHALFTPYGSTAAEVRALQPWGTELSPKVEVDFQVSGLRYRVTKGFLHDPSCRFFEWRDGRFRPVADGDRADEVLRSLLSASRPGKGAARPEHRGLARLLWMPQGEPISLALEGDLRARVERCLGVTTLDEGEARLLEIIGAQQSKFWTKTGRLAKSSGLPDLAERVEELRRQRERLASELEGMELLEGQIEGLQRKIEGLRGQQQELETRLGSLEQGVQELERLKQALQRAESDLSAWQARFEAADRQRTHLRDAQKQIADLDGRLARIDESLKALMAQEQELSARRAQAEEEALKAERAYRKTQDEERRGQALQKAREQLAEAERLGKRLRRAEELAEAYTAREEELAELPNPSPEDLRRARTLEQERGRLQGQLEAAGLTMSFKASVPVKGGFSADGHRKRTFHVDAGDEQPFTAAREAVITLDGVGTLQIRSGASEAARLHEKLRQVEVELQELLEGYDADSSADLEEAARRFAEREAELERLEQDLAHALDPYEDLTELKGALATVERSLAASCRGLELDRKGLKAQPEPDLDGLARRAAEADARLQEASGSLKALNDEWESTRVEKTRLEQDQAALKAARAVHQETVQRIVAEHGSEQAVEEAYQEARREREASQEKVKELLKKLPEEEQDPERAYRRAQRSLEQVLQELEARKEELNQARGQIRSVSEKGVYQQLAKVEERLALEKARYTASMREAEAIRLLHQLVTDRQKARTQALTDPVSERVSRYFARVTGRPRRQVRVGEFLKPESLHLPVVEGADPGLLSAGAQEQLFVLTRLALARYLASAEGRQLFVLDDTLVNSDPVRHQRLVELLEEATEDLQVVVLTCHGEWYRGLEGRYHTMMAVS